MNDMGDVEFLLKEICRVYDEWCMDCSFAARCLDCPHTGAIEELTTVLLNRYGMEVFGSVSSDVIRAENSVCSVTVKRERKYKNDNI